MTENYDFIVLINKLIVLVIAF